jgi:hypothetical protein
MDELLRQETVTLEKSEAVSCSQGFNSLPREGAGFSFVLPRQRRPYSFRHLTFFNNENTAGKHKATINQLAQVGHHRRQFRAILSVVAVVDYGSQVGDGLAVRNFQRFRGHAQVRGGQWGATDDRNVSAGASR